MTKAYDSELRALQERAYGRGADIHMDPEALRRLRELEHRGGDLLDPATPGDTADAVEPATSAHPRPAPAATPTPRRRLRLAAVAVLAALLGGALGVTGTLLASRWAGKSAPTHAEQVARLRPDTAYSLPQSVINGTGGDKVRAFADFHGMRTLVTETGGTTDPQWCIAVYPDSQLASTSAPSDTEGSSGCSAGAFPATAQFPITRDSPSPLRAAFRTDTALQFVYDKARNEIVVTSAR